MAKSRNKTVVNIKKGKQPRQKLKRQVYQICFQTVPTKYIGNIRISFMHCSNAINFAYVSFVKIQEITTIRFNIASLPSNVLYSFAISIKGNNSRAMERDNFIRYHECEMPPHIPQSSVCQMLMQNNEHLNHVLDSIVALNRPEWQHNY